MAARTITVFYAWQSDTPLAFNKSLIRKALDDAAGRINADPTSGGVRVVIDADTEGVVGTPPVTETILKKIAKADVFAPDLTFVAKTGDGKLVPNPNVMIEYGYALKALSFEAMMPIMNTHFGPPEKLPFDMGHVRHPLQYGIEPAVPDAERRKIRSKLSESIEEVLRLMAADRLQKVRDGNPFQPITAKRPPAFFFDAGEVLANFGNPGEQEMWFKRSQAIYIRLYPTYADQPRVGNSALGKLIPKLKPASHAITAPSTKNDFGAIVVMPHGNGITSFTQAFESGELWGVSEQPFRSGNPPAVVAIAVEKGFAETLENYLNVFANDFKFTPPFTLEVGATGLKGLHLLVPSQEFANGDYAGPINKDSLSKTYRLESFARAEWQGALRDYLIEFYDLASRSRADVLTDSLVTANDISPR